MAAPMEEPLQVDDVQPQIENQGIKKDFVEVPLEKKRVPKRILHFSDGILEEFSSDEEELYSKNEISSTNDPQLMVVTRTPGQQVAAVDPKTLAWGAWFWFYLSTMATNALYMCDLMGESLSNAFGITTPKYQYAIDEYHRMVAEEEEERKREERERAAAIAAKGGIELQAASTWLPRQDAGVGNKDEVPAVLSPPRSPAKSPSSSSMSPSSPSKKSSSYGAIEEREPSPVHRPQSSKETV